MGNSPSSGAGVALRASRRIPTKYITPSVQRQPGVGPDVTIYVGRHQREYNLHKEILCLNSSYFSKVFSDKDFKESQDNELALPEHEVNVFRHIVNFLYTGRFNASWSIEQNAQLFVYADYFGIPALKLDAMGTICHGLEDPANRPGMQCEELFIQAMKTMFHMYHCNKEFIIDLLESLATGGYTHEVITHPDVETFLKGDPELLFDIVKVLSRSCLSTSSTLPAAPSRSHNSAFGSGTAGHSGTPPQPLSHTPTERIPATGAEHPNISIGREYLPVALTSVTRPFLTGSNPPRASAARSVTVTPPLTSKGPFSPRHYRGSSGIRRSSSPRAQVTPVKPSGTPAFRKVTISGTTRHPKPLQAPITPGPTPRSFKRPLNFGSSSDFPGSSSGSKLPITPVTSRSFLGGDGPPRNSLSSSTSHRVLDYYSSPSLSRKKEPGAPGDLNGEYTRRDQLVASFFSSSSSRNPSILSTPSPLSRYYRFHETPTPARNPPTAPSPGPSGVQATSRTRGISKKRKREDSESDSSTGTTQRPCKVVIKEEPVSD